MQLLVPCSEKECFVGYDITVLAILRRSTGGAIALQRHYRLARTKYFKGGLRSEALHRRCMLMMMTAHAVMIMMIIIILRLKT